MNTYTVLKGDTLYGIAKQFNTTVDVLKRINNLLDNNITVGQILNISSNPTNTYTVKKGDNLYSIARLYNTTVNELMNLNNLKSTILSIGQILSVPANDNITENITYVVKPGDTLYSIALKYNTTVDVLKRINNLISNNLSVGQSLIITKETPNVTLYIVKPGDTLFSIAKKFGMTVEQLKQLNNLTSNTLSVGQFLNVNAISSGTEIKECFGEDYKEDEIKYITYTVKKGDNLYAIAQKYNTSIDNIKKLNNLTSNLLSIGQVLKIKEES